MKTKILYTIPLILIMFFGMNAFALEVRVAGDRLSVEADQTPLQSILKRLAGLGIRISVDPEINPSITASFKSRDIQKGLGSILKSLDHALIWEAVQGPSGPIPRLAEIQVFRQGKKGLMKPLVTDSNLSIVKNPRDGSFLVKDEILLRLKPGTDPSELKRILRQIGGILVDSQPGLGIYQIRLPENTDVPSLVDRIKDQASLEEAEPNYAYPLPPPLADTGSGESTQIFSEVSLPGGRVPVAILDTGMNSDADSLGHGTQMALIAAGVIRPDGVNIGLDTHTPIIPIRSFDDNGFTSNFNIMDSIDFALEHEAKVLSLSWGAETHSEFLESAMNYADSKGLVIVASAGNEPTGKPVYPAAYSSVMGVGAIGKEGKPWENSNYGDFVTIYAPGFATFPVGYKGDPGVYAGTSISAAFVANLVADILSRNPTATKQEIMKVLTGRN
jgi:hypothetical protein